LPLPALSLEGLPAAVRQDLAAAHAAAVARPADAAAAGRLAMLLHAYEQHSLAAAAYERARRLEPGAVEWSYLAAVVAGRIGDHARAVSLLREVLGAQPGRVTARLRLADELFSLGAFEESRAAYDAMTRTFPDFALAHFGLGRIASSLGRDEEAVAHFERAVAASPQFGRAHYALALAHRNAGRLDRAQGHLEAYRKLGAREPALPDPVLESVAALRSTARDLIAEGARLGGEGRLEESIAVHLKALEADPGSSQAHVNLISLYGRRGRVQEAEAHYRKALALKGNLAEAHYNYGVLLASAGRRADAAEAFRRTLAIDPFHAAAHNNLGGLLAGQGVREEAAGHFRQALAVDPAHRGARAGLAQLLLMLGRPAEAIAHLERLIAVEGPDTPHHLYALARAWLAEGDSRRARRYAEEARQAAIRLDQRELAGRIERDLERMPRDRP
jgi:tetratricopeptide (TPR) repeat protein